MRIKLHNNWDPQIDVFTLTRGDIESQVSSDFVSYSRTYHSKYHKSPSYPIDVENYIKEVWGVDVQYRFIPQTDPENEILGYLDYGNKVVVVDPDLSKNDYRLNFTIAHEAGHLSLHGSTLALQDGVVVTCIEKHDLHVSGAALQESNQRRREWQAHQYAAILLAPKIELYKKLRELGLANYQEMIIPLDLNLHSKVLQESFGLSRYALELRLKELGITAINKKYLAT